MTDVNKKARGQETMTIDANPLIRELRRRLSEPGPWARRFRRLAEAVAGSPGLSCEECDDVLDLYVDDELGGRDVRRLHPLVWQHLRACTGCRQAHDLLADTLSRERAGELPPVPCLGAPRLSFLQAHPPDAPWITRLRPRIGGAPFGLTFSFNLPYLRTLLSPPIPVAARAEDPLSPSASHLLLSDTVPVGEGTVAVQVTATRRPERPDCLHLRAIITASTPLPQNLRARLIWDDQARFGLVGPQGGVDFGQVSLATLQEALEAGEGSFEIAFEAQEIEDDAGSG
ncbi:MAG: hypothetical protein FJ014_04460 [Chloroflexi bacterium]|nr:hypothetical protein [Chloroflexota bacterium]